MVGREAPEGSHQEAARRTAFRCSWVAHTVEQHRKKSRHLRQCCRHSGPASLHVFSPPLRALAV